MPDADPSTTSVRPPADGGGLWSPQRRELTLGLVLTITLVAAEALAVSAAMPIVARDLGGLELYGLVFTAFMVGSLIGIVVAGDLIDRRGVVFPFLVGLGLFAVGLLVAGASPSMEILIASRFVQGLGGGAIPPVAYVAIGRSLPERLRPQMFAMLSTAWILPGVFGPGVGGAVAELLHWRLVFLGLLPLLAVSGWMALHALRGVAAAEAPGGGRSSGEKLRDALVVGFGVALLTGGLSADSPTVLAALVIPGLALTVYGFRRLVPPGTLQLARGYPSAILLRGFLTFAFFLYDPYVSLLLVEVRGWSAAAAGIALTAATVSWTLGSWTQARLSRRISHERFAWLGFGVVAAGTAGVLPVLLPDVPAWLVVPAFAIGGYGMGLGYAQFALIVLRDVQGPEQGAATSGLTLSDALGTALGAGIGAALIGASVRGAAGPGPGIGAAIVIATGVALLGLLLAPRLNREPAETPPSSGAAEAVR
ncbi:MAG TPA: MFS transporter [Candidatus Deferrimicrobiaceae bacterium]|nr:MFS transporter [Candidatus Deferrimicrobiaceae bacterium]